MEPILLYNRKTGSLEEEVGFEKSTTDEAIAELPPWMDLADLTEDDWVVLVEVGAILYREGLSRREA